MQTTDIDKRVREILGLVFKVDVPATGSFTRNDEPNWDSLKHVEMIFVLEDEFSVQFEEVDFPNLDSVAHIVTLLEERIAA